MKNVDLRSNILFYSILFEPSYQAVGLNHDSLLDWTLIFSSITELLVSVYFATTLTPVQYICVYLQCNVGFEPQARRKKVGKN